MSLRASDYEICGILLQIAPDWDRHRRLALLPERDATHFITQLRFDRPGWVSPAEATLDVPMGQSFMYFDPQIGEAAQPIARSYLVSLLPLLQAALGHWEVLAKSRGLTLLFLEFDTTAEWSKCRAEFADLARLNEPIFFAWQSGPDWRSGKPSKLDPRLSTVQNELLTLTLALLAAVAGIVTLGQPLPDSLGGS